MVVERKTNAEGGAMPFATVSARPEIVSEEPQEGAIAYTVLTPVQDFSGVVHHRKFVNGRTVTYDEALARTFRDDYRYAVEPPLPEIKVRPRASRTGKKQYVKA